MSKAQKDNTAKKFCSKIEKSNSHFDAVVGILI